MRLSGPASAGSDLAASSFRMASSSGAGQCKARGPGGRLGVGAVLAETRIGGSTCCGTSSRPQSPPTGPPQAPTARPPTVDTEKPEPRARGGGSGGPRRHARGQGPHPPAASEQQGFLLEVVPLPEGQAVELFHAHPKHFSELLG